MKELDISVMSPITQRLDTFLKEEGFSLCECSRVIGGHGRPVNDLRYMNEKEERVYVITHEPEGGAV